MYVIFLAHFSLSHQVEGILHEPTEILAHQPHNSVFAEVYPNAEVIGTDLSPTQPLWVPPNVKFELDDCTQPWTWSENSFDFVHIRYLFGAIADWDELLRQAYRVTRPGGWVQSCEADVNIRNDDDSIPPDSPYRTFWNMLYHDSQEKLGVTFQPIDDDVQRKALERAGFECIEVHDYKVSQNTGSKSTLRDSMGEWAISPFCCSRIPTLFSQ